MAENTTTENTTAHREPTPLAITLFRGFPAQPKYGPSPFSNKLEARLRIGHVLYRLGEGSPPKGPRGKIPYVEFCRARWQAQGSNPNRQRPATEKLGDSTLITRRFIEDGHMPDLNATLSPADKARDLAVRALLEDKLYFYQVRERWMDNYSLMRDTVLGFLLFPIRLIVGLFLYHANKRTLKGQGVLLYTKDEAADARLEIWSAVNAMLAESRKKALEGGKTGPFWVLGGARPSEADPVVFGFIVASLRCRAAPATEEIVRSYPIMLEYARRIHDDYFQEYERWED